MQAEDRLAALHKLANGKEQNLIVYTRTKVTRTPKWILNSSAK
jgi:hypothetical protein